MKSLLVLLALAAVVGYIGVTVPGYGYYRVDVDTAYKGFHVVHRP